MIATSYIEDEPTGSAPRVSGGDLSVVWPKISEAVYRRLRRLGANHDLAEDLTQDAALKVVAKQVAFTDESDLARFALHVARHCWIDHLRQTAARRTDVVAEIDGVGEDVAQSVVESLTARRALMEMRVRDRLALFGGGEATYVLRHRARVRLDRLWKSLGAWLAGIKIRGVTTRSKRVAMAAAGVTVIVGLAVGPVANRFGSGPAHTPDRTSAGNASHAGRLERADFGASAPTRAHFGGPGITPYRERVSLPTTHTKIGHGDEGLINGGTRPTEQGDPIVCVFNVPAIGTRCAGDASRVGRGVPVP